MNEFELIYRFDLSREDQRRIVNEYGSVSEFCNTYIRYLQGDRTVKIKIPKTMTSNITNFFDLSNAYGVGENSGYAQLVADILRIRPGFVTYGPIEEIVNSAMDEVLSEQDKDIIRALYNLDGKNRALDDLELIYNINQKDILARKQRGVKRIAAGKKKGQLQLLSKLIVDRAVSEEVLQNLLEKEDAVAENDYSKLSKRKHQLVEAILLKEIEYITYTGSFEYIFQSFVVKTKISTSILSDEKKRELLDKTNIKVKEIANDNGEEIIEQFQNRINNFVHDDNENRKYVSLEKEIRNSGLDEETIDMLISKLPKTEKAEEINDLNVLKNNLIRRVRFPRSDLSIDEMSISDKAREVFRKSNLINVGSIIQYSKNELRKFACLRAPYIDEVFSELEQIGYDIPEEDSVSIESYNHDKIHEDSLSKIAEEIQNSDLNDESKAYLINIALSEAIKKLESEYDKMNRLIRTYKDIFRTHEIAKVETADEERYRRKVKEAESKRDKIKKQLEELGR